MASSCRSIVAASAKGSSRSRRVTRWATVARSTSAQPRADALFADELHGGQEKILEQAELVAVERVDRGERGGRVVAEIAEQLADVGPEIGRASCRERV